MIAVQDVEKEITFCQRVALPIVGVIENMSGYVCPHCSNCCNVFSSGGGEMLAQAHNLPFLGRVPICPAVARLLEGGETDGQSLLAKYKETDLHPIFDQIARDLTARDQSTQ